jgi:hypothetical protein
MDTVPQPSSAESRNKNTQDNKRKRQTGWGSLFAVPTVNIIQDQQVTGKI